MKKTICVAMALMILMGLIVGCQKKQDIVYLVLANKENKLPDDWEEKLQTVKMNNSLGDEVEVEKQAYDAYLKLKDDLEKQGIYVDPDTARRSVAAQQDIWGRFLEEYPEIWAAIHEILADHGFILRYLEGRETITGYGYEPWHICYVGSSATKEIRSRGMMLENYLNKLPETGVTPPRDSE